MYPTDVTMFMEMTNLRCRYTPSDIIVDEALAVVSYDGTVLYIPVVYRNIPCNKISSVLLYCPFKYGSWAVDVFKVSVYCHSKKIYTFAIFIMFDLIKSIQLLQCVSLSDVFV